PVAPALRTRTRGRSRAAVSGSVASAATVSTRPLTSRASAASAPGSRAMATTRMPAPASASTMPRPKPRLPPVTTAVWSRSSTTALLHSRVAAIDEEAAARAARLAVPALEPAAAVGARPQVRLGVGLLWDLLHRARRLPTAGRRRDQAGSAF